MTTTTAGSASRDGGRRSPNADSSPHLAPNGQSTPAAAAGEESQAKALSAWAHVSTTSVLFVIGCVLLVGCASAIDRLGDWSAEYGRIWVFLGFFLAMSLGGRWFWAGADTAIAWTRTHIRR